MIFNSFLSINILKTRAGINVYNTNTYFAKDHIFETSVRGVCAPPENMCTYHYINLDDETNRMTTPDIYKTIKSRSLSQNYYRHKCNLDITQMHKHLYCRTICHIKNLHFSLLSWIDFLTPIRACHIACRNLLCGWHCAMLPDYKPANINRTMWKCCNERTVISR